MASITVRKLDEKLKQRLRCQAAEHGRSLEAEVREILSRSINQPQRAPQPKTGLDLIRPLREFVDKYGGIELPIPPRTTIRDIPDFSDSPRKSRRRK